MVAVAAAVVPGEDGGVVVGRLVGPDQPVAQVDLVDLKL